MGIYDGSTVGDRYLYMYHILDKDIKLFEHFVWF